MNNRFLLAVLVAASVAGCSSIAPQAELIEPKVYRPSPDGQRDLTVLAANGTQRLDGQAFNSVHNLFMFGINGDPPSLSPGIIAVNPGETVALALINDLDCQAGLDQMDPDTGAKMVAYPDIINFHFHGGQVSPHNKAPDGVYGDYVFNSILSRKNCAHDPAATPRSGPSGSRGARAKVVAASPTIMTAASADGQHHHHTMEAASVEQGSAHYRFVLKGDHYPGLMWFHPHVHGVSEPEIGGGLSGLITVGSLWDYATAVCAVGDGASGECAPGNQARDYVQVRHLMLKDLALRQEGSGWTYAPGGIDPCTSPGDARGYCTSGNLTERTLFTVNGQILPKITVADDKSLVLRIANMSPTISYSLRFRLEGGPAGHFINVPFKIIAKDGVSIPSSASDGWQDAVVGGNEPALLMPASRLEVFLSPHKACEAAIGGNAADLCRGQMKVTMVQTGYLMDNSALPGVLPGKRPCDGQNAADGDTWCPVDLVTLLFPALDNKAKDMRPGPPRLRVKASGGVPGVSAPPRLVAAAADPAGLRKDAKQKRDEGLCADQDYVSLSSSKYRLIKLLNGENDKKNEVFQMSTTLIDCGTVSCQDYAPDVLATFNDTLPLRKMRMERDDMCVGRAGTNYAEIWVVKNDSKEMHNFHLHQTKYTVLATSDSGQEVLRLLGTPWMGAAIGTARAADGQSKHDTFPIPPGGWIQIRIDFNDNMDGRFVYHCHILEHEDKGMMSAISVKDFAKTTH